MGCCDFYGFSLINSSLPDLAALNSLAVQIKDNHKDVCVRCFKITGALLGLCMLTGKYTGQNHSKHNNG